MKKKISFICLVTFLWTMSCPSSLSYFSMEIDISTLMVVIASVATVEVEDQELDLEDQTIESDPSTNNDEATTQIEEVAEGEDNEKTITE